MADMLILVKLKRLIGKYLTSVNPYLMAAVGLGFTVFSWVMLVFAGETALTAFPDFFYWLLVTISTVGFGDLSPTTPAGKLVVGFFVIPFGLSLFAVLVGRLGAFGVFHWQKGIRGLMTLNYRNHILLIGWNEGRTLHLINLLLEESEQGLYKDIVLCVQRPMENPLSGRIGFVVVESFTRDKDMDRACITSAGTIIPSPTSTTNH
jgi:voltage-gated potassium channel